MYKAWILAGLLCDPGMWGPLRTQIRVVLPWAGLWLWPLWREQEMGATKQGGRKYSLHGDHILTLICGVSPQVFQK